MGLDHPDGTTLYCIIYVWMPWSLVDAGFTLAPASRPFTIQR